jgi:hypothetical protein
MPRSHKLIDGHWTIIAPTCGRAINTSRWCKKKPTMLWRASKAMFMRVSRSI